jgi:hypothetical protein
MVGVKKYPISKFTAASTYGKWFKQFGSIILVPGNRTVRLYGIGSVLVTIDDKGHLGRSTPILLQYRNEYGCCSEQR